VAKFGLHLEKKSHVARGGGRGIVGPKKSPMSHLGGVWGNRKKARGGGGPHEWEGGSPTGEGGPTRGGRRGYPPSAYFGRAASPDCQTGVAGWESEGEGRLGCRLGSGGGRTLRTYKVMTNTHATINVQ